VSSASNWFEKNPKKTIAALIGLVLVLMTIMAEKFLAYRHRDFHAGIQRYIRLREYRPYFSQDLLPPEAELQIADNLERQPYRLRIDGDGFIMPSRVHEKPDLSLVFLGGSSTACGYMGETERFPYQVGRLIEKETGKKINSFNSGVGGNNSMHSLNILFNKVIPLKPEVVFLCHNINDLTTLLLEGSYWSTNPSRSNLVTVKPSISGSLKELRDLLIPYLSREVNQISRELKQTFRRSNKKAPGEDEFARVRDKKIQVDEAGLRQSFRNNLQLFIELCRLHQIQPVLLTQANRLKETPDAIIKVSLQDLEKRQGLPYREYKRLFDAFNEEIRDVGRKNGILVIDLAAQIPPEKEYLYDIVHFTAQGSGRAAERIAAEMKAQLPDSGKK
jgi:lysophospholipase L1-like esterase